MDSTEYDSMNDEPCWWEQGKLIPTQSNAFPTQIMRWKDVERSKSMNDFALFGEVVIILCGLPEVPRFNKIVLIAIYGIWTVTKIIDWLSKKLKERELISAYEQAIKEERENECE